jgi:hypothetical protein
LIRKAILWAGESTTASRPVAGPSSGHRAEARDGVLAVDVDEGGAYQVEVRALDGTLVARKRGNGSETVSFEGLAKGAVYSVTVHGRNGRHSHLVPLR